jgi:dienelactone hydrolase
MRMIASLSLALLGAIRPDPLHTEGGADWQFVSFGGAVHSFTVKEAGDDPSKGAAYNEKADRRSWEMLKAFLTECFN